MIVPATTADFSAIIAGQSPAPWRLVQDSVIAPAQVLTMLADLADTIRSEFDPAAWMMIEDGEIAGLLSVVVPVADRSIRIGYGTAPTRSGRGIAGRAVGDLLAWARGDDRVDRVTAETSHENIASQRVLMRGGFARIGERFDEEDGALIVWEALTGSRASSHWIASLRSQ